ncbi:MsnO8 family LLM class oxidoreductase [Actinokineospora auranticolor]|uniref:Luciferase family oxidoreductase group 1 n=1 Tax=Actinokineospora auranticolor TaxID=155976 RepID=A0A2S6H1S8_9PSEU|nr:MsnO8 family LLM class oxidoreductase [Actinokineospora auranticolor]PPK71414.1 luciferase family oxidoreductase group 1 [Actinokineospora auranticolor]
MGKAVAVSVHDTAPVWSGDTAGDALRRSISLAEAVDELGYARYWVAEHHSTPALATSAPVVLAGQVLAATSTIRAGSGAVLLPNHSPLAVAEQFGVLASLYPGRVDLGLGRGSGGSPVSAARLGDPVRREFDAQFAELSGYFANAGRGVGGVRAVPEPTEPPAFWMVGSSPGSAAYAGRLGLPFVFAHSIVPGLAVEALAAYRASFTPSPWRAEPYAGVAAIVVAADSEDRAWEQANAFVLGQIRMRTVDPNTTLPTAADAKAHRFSGAEERFRREKTDPQFIGTPRTITPRLAAFLAQTGADELMALTQVPDHDARVRSYELLAKTVLSL